MVIKPVNDQVLVRLDSAEETSAGGILLVQSEPVRKNTGVVEAIGDSSVIGVKPGDHVAFEKGMGRRFNLPRIVSGLNGVKYTEQVPYILLSYFDVIGKVEAG